MKKIELSELQSHWVSVLGVAVGIIAFGFATTSISSNVKLKNNIANDTAQIAKLNADSKQKANAKSKVEVNSELPGIYKDAMNQANSIAAAQNAYTQELDSNGKLNNQSQAYQAAYYTLNQYLADDANFKPDDVWNYNKQATVRVFPGDYDGYNHYHLLFVVTAGNQNSNVIGYYKAYYSTDDKKIHDIHYYTTDAANNPTNNGGKQTSGDASFAKGVQSQIKEVKDSNGKLVKAKIIPGQQPGSFTIVQRYSK